MKKPVPEPIAFAAENRAADADLSADIAQAIGREPLDRVKVVRVFGDYYRCNWWAPFFGEPRGSAAFDWGVSATHRVRKSRFLNATVREGKLVVEEVARPQS